MFSESEQGEILNKGGPGVALPDLLGPLGLHAVVRPATPSDAEVDAFVEVSTPSGASRTYVLEVKRHVPPELATALHPWASLPTLVVARSITERAAELLRARGIDYVDVAGNAHIAWDDVFVHVQGRRKAVGRKEAPSSRGSKAFGRAGLKAGLVLLGWPHMAGEPLRRLAGAAGISLGTAKAVVDDLSNAGYLYDVRGGGRRLARAGELLSRWSEAYSTTLSPALLLGGFSTEGISWWSSAKEELAKSNVQLGGEVAASLMDAHLTPSTLTLYADEVPRALVGAQRMVRAEKDGNVQFRRRFWKMGDEGPLVPHVLTYADLLASGDPRQREHADRIRASDDRLAELDRL